MTEVQGNERTPVKDAPAVANEPRGIGGWLLLVAVGQVVGPLRMLVGLGQMFIDPDTLQAFERVPLATYGEFALNLALTLLAIATAILFFRKSRYFPRFFICELVAAFVIPALAVVWVALILSARFGQPFGEFLALEPQEVAQLILAVVTALIWIPYTLKSKRVRNTFGDDPRQGAAPTVDTATAPRVPLLRTVVVTVIAMGSVSVLAGLAHAIGRGAFSGNLLGGLLQIALAVWLLRGSNAARIILAVLFFVGFVFALSLPVLAPERDMLLIGVTVTVATLTGVGFWILAFSQRLRAEMAMNKARYREPENARSHR
jgi:Protein of unknown function (DUF2569)